MSPRVARRSVVVTCLAALLAVGASSTYQWHRALPFGWAGLCVQFESHFTDQGRQQRSKLRIEDVQPRSPASTAGLEKGERIVALNGSSEGLIGRFAAVRAGENVAIEVENKAGHRQTHLTMLHPFSALRVSATIAFLVTLALIALCLGTFVLARRPDDGRALLLFVLMMLFAIRQFADAGPMHRYGIDSDASLIQLLVVVGAGLFYFPVLLHLFLVFPSRRPVLRDEPRLVQKIYGPPALLALTIGSVLILVIRVLPPESRELGLLVHRVHAAIPALTWIEPGLLVGAGVLAVVSAWTVWRTRNHRLRFITFLLTGSCGLLSLSAAARLAALTGLPGLTVVALLCAVVALVVTPLCLVLIAYPIAACLACWRNYREADADGRRQLRWPLLGLLLAIGGYLLTAPVVQLLASLHVWPRDSVQQFVAWWYIQHAPQFALLLIPASIAFAILRYRLFDIDVYVRRTVIYGGLTAVLALAVALVIAGAATLLSRSFAFEGSWSPVAATVVAGALVLPVRARIQTAVDSRFYRRRDYPASLARITVRMANDPHDYASVVVEVQEAIPARSASLWLRSSEAPVFELAAHSGPSPSGLTRISVSLSEEHLRSTGSYIQQLPYGQGHLVVGAKLAETTWDEHDRNFLSAVSGQISLAATGLSREEAERAAEIQKALLPTVLPQPHGWTISALSQPARNVGGDYYDVIQLDDDRVAFAIADVSGKGVPAALLMANVQAGLRLLAREENSPARLCARLNSHVCSSVNPGRFVTFLYGVLRVSTGEFRYCNAGHNPPVVQCPTASGCRLETGGVPLGVVADYRYSEASINLGPADRLVLYTDGVCDATNENDEEFGDAGLLNALSECSHSDATRLKDVIFDLVAEHCGGVFSDDVTLLVACCKGNQGSPSMMNGTVPQSG